MLNILSNQPRCATLVPFEFIIFLGALVLSPMSGKRQKLPTKRGWASEDPTPNFDVMGFVNEGVADQFGTICKNRSFIKEKGFHTLMIFSARRLRPRDGGHFANHLIQLR